MLTAYGVGSVEHIRFFKIGSAVVAESPLCGSHDPPLAMQRYRTVMVRPNRDLHLGVSRQLSAASLCNDGPEAKPGRGEARHGAEQQQTFFRHLFAG
jgi:hypothetical protein